MSPTVSPAGSAIDDAVTVGVDLGGTKIAAGLVAATGEVLHRTRRDTPVRDAAGALRIVGDAVRELVAMAHAAGLGEPSGIGIGVAGFVDHRRREVRFGPNLGWRETPVADLLEQQVGLAVVVENDANAASWGEFCYGAARTHDDMVCVTVGTGIGGGIVSAGRLVRGGYGIAGEIGHLRLEPDGRPCGCGRRGCWEQYASGNALVRTARELAAERRSQAGLLLSYGDGSPEGVTGRHVTAAAQAGDPVAAEAFARIGEWLGRGLAELAAILDPEVYVVGGGVIAAGELLLAPTRRTFEAELVGAEHRPVATLVAAELGDDAGIVGAADLARRPA